MAKLQKKNNIDAITLRRQLNQAIIEAAEHSIRNAFGYSSLRDYRLERVCSNPKYSHMFQHNIAIHYRDAYIGDDHIVTCNKCEILAQMFSDNVYFIVDMNKGYGA